LRGLSFGTEDGEPVPMILRLDPDAADALHEWRLYHHERSELVSGLLASAWGKMPGTVLRLAMILQLAWWSIEGGLEPSTVSRRALTAAIALVESYLKPMTARVYGDAALPEVERNAAALARYIRAIGADSVNARDLRRSARLPGLRDDKPISAALAFLADAGWLRPDPGHGIGRPRKDYRVNPKVKDPRR
jgi:hypothetical protein